MILLKNDKTNYSAAIKKYFSHLIFYLSITTVIILIDQITKKLAVKYLKPIIDYPLIKDFFHLTYAENKGAAFSMLTDQRWIFMVLSSVSIIGFIIYLILYSGKIKILLGISIAFICGGGIGNMIDRINPGYVVDFFNFELIDFAIFNGADTFICIGAGLLVLYTILYEFRTGNDKRKPNEHTS